MISAVMLSLMHVCAIAVYLVSFFLIRMPRLTVQIVVSFTYIFLKHGQIINFMHYIAA